MRISEISDIIESYAPGMLAEDYDNVGLLLGNGEREAKKVLLSLDVDEFVAEEAVRWGADMIVCHHPIMFSPIKKITSETSEGRCILKLIENKIALYAAHTNLDSAKGGLNDLMCEILSLENCSPLSGDSDTGIGRVGDLPYEMTLGELAERVKELFSLDCVRYSGAANRKVKTIALCSGGGGSLVYDAVSSGADVYISGDLKYNNVRDLVFSGMGFVEIPHYSSEIFAPRLFEKLLQDVVETRISQCNVNIFSYI